MAATTTIDAKDVTVTCANCGRTGTMPGWLVDDFDGRCPSCKLSHAVNIEAAVETFDSPGDDVGPNWPPAEPRDDEYFHTQSKDGAHGRAAALSDGPSSADELPDQGETREQSRVSPANCGAGDHRTPAFTPGADAPAGASVPFPHVGGELPSTTVCHAVLTSTASGAGQPSAPAPRHSVIVSDNLSNAHPRLTLVAVMVFPWERRIA